MCDSEGTRDCSTSISVGEVAKLDERKKSEVRQIEVCEVSDEDLSPVPSPRRRLVFGKDDSRELRPRAYKHKLRAKIPGTDRFNPLQDTPAEAERKKQKRAEKRRRDLEDDAGSKPEGAGDNSAPVEAQVGECLRPTKFAKRGSSRRRNVAPEAIPPARKKRSNSDGKLQSMIFQVNESLRPPGTGKKTKRNTLGRTVSAPVHPVARGDSTRITRSATRVSAPPRLNPAPSAVDSSKVFRGFFHVLDESALKKLRGDFSLPFLSQRASEAPAGVVGNNPGHEESNAAPAPNIVETVAVPAVLACVPPDESEFIAELDLLATLPVPASETEFSAKLEIELGKPFSGDELRELMSSVKRQTPIVKSLELRGQRSVEFCTEKEGYSYLDYHPGLANALRHSEDDPEDKLRLLRGFFFWIEHACMEGSFRPWEPKEDIILIDE